MTLIFKNSQYEVWEVEEDYGMDYYIYGVYNSGDPKVVPSLSMVHDIVGQF